jgi:hypothetical protein
MEPAIRSTTVAAISSSEMSAAIFSTAWSGRSLTSMPAACLTISAIGQYVMPSP